MKILLFDIDGTLINAGPASGRAFNAAFKELFDIDPVTDGVKIHGATDPQICRDITIATFSRCLTDKEYNQLIDLYVALLYVEIEVEPDYCVMPGVQELLQTLKNHDDILVGLQTGNIEQAVHAKLSRAGLFEFFDFGGFGTDSADRSEIISLALERAKDFHRIREVCLDDVFVIGDSPQDIRAAKKVGVKAIGVETGIYSFEELITEEPHCVVSDLSDVESIYSLFVA